MNNDILNAHLCRVQQQLVDGNFGTPGEIRTHNMLLLRQPPLPVGIPEHEMAGCARVGLASLDRQSKILPMNEHPV